MPFGVFVAPAMIAGIAIIVLFAISVVVGIICFLFAVAVVAMIGIPRVMANIVILAVIPMNAVYAMFVSYLAGIHLFTVLLSATS